MLSPTEMFPAACAACSWEITSFTCFPEFSAIARGIASKFKAFDKFLDRMLLEAGASVGVDVDRQLPGKFKLAVLWVL